MGRQQRGIWGLSLALVGLLGGTALAQPNAGFPAERLRPAMDRLGIIDVESGATLGFLEYDAALWLTYARNPLVLYRRIDGELERAGTLVRDRLGAELSGAFSIGYAELGVALPFALVQGRGRLDPTLGTLGGLSSGGLGDLRVTPKVPILRAADFGFDLAVLAQLSLPTGTPRGAYLGETSLSVVPEVAASITVAPLRLAGNLGVRVRDDQRLLDLRVSDELTYRFGAAMDLEAFTGGQPIEVAASLNGATALARPFRHYNQNPLELLLQGSYRLPYSLRAFLGVGAGIIAGFGNPDVRVFAGLRWEPGTGTTPPPPLFTEEEESHSAVVTAERIELIDTVHFATGKSTIEQRSWPLLDEVAKLLRDRPNIKKVRIEGHTDNSGDAEDNQVLSQDRADAVRRYLVKKGVARERLEAFGYGESKPIADNDKEAGRQKNRRVEFTILESSDKGDAPADR